MRVYESISDGIRDLRMRAAEAERDHGRYDRILAAKGDCSVVSGWSGKLPIKAVRSLLAECAGKVLAYKAAADVMEEAVRQVTERNLSDVPPISAADAGEAFGGKS